MWVDELLLMNGSRGLAFHRINTRYDRSNDNTEVLAMKTIGAKHEMSRGGQRLVTSHNKPAKLVVFLSRQILPARPCKVITHCQGKQNHQPEESRDDDDPRQTCAVAHMHKIKNDQRCFDNGDGERNNCIRAVKNMVKISEGRCDSKNGADY